MVPPVRILVSVVLWAVTGLLVIIDLPILAISRLLTQNSDPGRRVTGRLFRWIGKFIAIINPLWHFRVENRARTAFHEPSLVVSNHESEADIYLTTFLPWDMKYLSKASVYDMPVMGWAMRLVDDVGVVRGDRRSGVKALIEVRRRLKAGVSVIVFPEGTRSRTGELLPFKDGAFRLAVDMQVPIQPVAIAGTRNALRPGSLLMGKANAVIRILEPVPTEGLTSKDVSALTERVREMVAQARSELQVELGIGSGLQSPGDRVGGAGRPGTRSDDDAGQE